MAAGHSNGITVRVVEFSDRTHFQMQYRDPLTGRKVTRSTGVERTNRQRDRDAAQQEAGKWQAELRDGRYSAPSKTTWADFRERYEAEVLSSLAETTDKKVAGVFNSVEAILNPARLIDLTASRLSGYQAKLRENGAADSTIKGHLAHLGAALNWAKRMGLLVAVPTIEMPRRAKGSKIMKGRPITGEEFDRMMDKVAVVVAPLSDDEKAGDTAPDRALVATWKHYLRGLWTSGLRLAESLELCWDRDDKLCIDLTGKRPMLRIPAALEKGNQDRLLPIAPEFAELLLETPADDRMGFVFKPGTRRHSKRLSVVTVGRTVSAIGEKAGVKVNTDQKTAAVKFASAHDLRRSFGERWASRVMPQVLMELMRHESIDTTMKYYVGRNAQATADVLWQAHEAQKAIAGNTSGNSGQKTATDQETDKQPKPAREKRVKKRGAGGSRTHDGGFAIRCLSHLATAPGVELLGNRRAGLGPNIGLTVQLDGYVRTRRNRSFCQLPGGFVT